MSEPTAQSVQVTKDDLNALATTISFLSSVIRAGEPYTPHVQQAVENAHHRITRMFQNEGWAAT